VNIYYNTDYIGTAIDFETFKKSEFVADLLREKSDIFSICDPSERELLDLVVNLIKDNISPEYYAALRSGEPQTLAVSNGLGWDIHLFDQIVASTAGIIAAVNDVLALGDKRAASLSSGLHHARWGHGSAFCSVNSLALAAIFASRVYGAKVTIVDFDAHCGGGTWSYIVREYGTNNTNISQLDLSISSLDYWADSRNNKFAGLVGVGDSALMVLSLGHGTSSDKRDETYLKAVDEMLARIPTTTNIVLYNAGVDIWPVISKSAVAERDRRVALAVKQFPTVVVLAGGYGQMKDIAPLHLATMEALAAA
jgi:acetoin utilization deacetylase AcuC-like enzyme